MFVKAEDREERGRVGKTESSLLAHSITMRIPSMSPSTSAKKRASSIDRVLRLSLNWSSSSTIRGPDVIFALRTLSPRSHTATLVSCKSPICRAPFSEYKSKGSKFLARPATLTRSGTGGEVGVRVMMRIIIYASARNMREEERELQDFASESRYPRNQEKAASIGSVRCWTSARTANRISFHMNLSANRSRILKVYSNGLRTVIWIRWRRLLFWCLWRFILLPKALLLLCFLKRRRARRPLLHGGQRSPWQRYICRNCNIIIIFCTFPCAFVILICRTCLP